MCQCLHLELSIQEQCHGEIACQKKNKLLQSNINNYCQYLTFIDIEGVDMIFKRFNPP